MSSGDPRGGSLGVPVGVLGGPGGSLGGPWGSLKVPRESLGDPGGPWGGPGEVRGDAWVGFDKTFIFEGPQGGLVGSSFSARGVRKKPWDPAPPGTPRVRPSGTHGLSQSLRCATLRFSLCCSVRFSLSLSLSLWLRFAFRFALAPLRLASYVCMHMCMHTNMHFIDAVIFVIHMCWFDFSIQF